MITPNALNMEFQQMTRQSRAALLALATLAVVPCTSHADEEPGALFNDWHWPEFSFTGFGTVGAVATNTDEAQYVRELQPKGAKKSGSLLVDSNLGLQVTAKVTDWLSGTAQTLTAQRTEEDLSTRFEWAFIKVTPAAGLNLRAGKFSLPNFLISDSRRVGYANTSLRPSNEVYGLDLLNGGLKGGDVSYRQPVLDSAIIVTALYGTSSLNRSGSSPTDVKNVKGLNLIWDGDWYTIRVGQISAEPQLTGPIAIDETYRFTGVGGTIDHAGVVLQGEYVTRHSSQFNFAIGAKAWYLLGGYRLGSYLPYVMLAERKPESGSEVTPQKSVAIGLRWDAFNSAAVKFQLEHIDTKGTAGSSFITPTAAAEMGPPVAQGIGKPVTTISAAIDFVF